jgi:hypothetical protein
VQRIVLQPSPMERGLFQDQYDALIEDLREQGYDVELEVPIETRGVPEAQWMYDLTVHVGEVAKDALAVGALVAILRKHLRGKIGRRGSTRRGCIYLPNDERHLFDMPDE